jgi:T5SS/PEP-CTERM-associated repeat protein
MLQVDGAFKFNGRSFNISTSGRLTVGNPAQSSISASDSIYINNGANFSVNSISSASDVTVTQSTIHVLDNFTQTAGNFAAVNLSMLQVDNAFNFDGSDFNLSGGGRLTVGGPAQSSINTAGTVYINNGANLSVNSISSASDVTVTQSTVHVLDNFTQTGGNFVSNVSAMLQVDGKFNFTGNSFELSHGGRLTVGNAAQSSIQTAGPVLITNDAHVTLGNVTAGADVHLDHTGLLHVLGNYTQTGGGFYTDADALLQVDGEYHFNGNGFRLSYGGTLDLANPALGSINTSGGVLITNGADLTIGSIVAESDVIVDQPGSSLHVLGNFTQSAGSLTTNTNAQLQVDGTFNYTGNDFRVQNGAAVTTASAVIGTADGISNGVSVFGNSSWHVTSNLQVAGSSRPDAVATLNVWDNASMTVGNTLTVGSNGKLGGNGTVQSSAIIVDKGGEVGGTLTLQGTVTNQGQVAPAFSSSMGVLSVSGDYTQPSDGTLQVEFGGTTAGVTYDQLAVTGVANVSGRVDVPIAAGYVPQLNDQIIFLTASSVNGIFDSLSSANLSTAGGGLALELTKTATDARIRFVATSSANQFQGVAALSNWTDADNWSLNSIPTSANIVALQSLTSIAQEIASSENQFVHSLSVTGAANTISLAVTNGSSFSALAGTSINNNGIIDVDSGRFVTNSLNVSTSGLLKLENGGRFYAHSSTGTAGTLNSANNQMSQAGRVVVTGANSEFRADGLLLVGTTGAGSLTIQNQGTAQSTTAYVGQSNGSAGSVTIDGANSQWLVDDSLYIGGSSSNAGGSGTVSVTNNGRLFVGKRLHVWQDSSLTVDSTAIASVGNGAAANIGGTLQVLPGGTLSGKGTIHANTINRGLVRPGASPGIIAIDGDYTQQSDGTLEIEIAGLVPGAEHDQVQVAGQASIDGSIEFPITNGFIPQAGMGPLTFLTASGVTGAPKTQISPNLNAAKPNVGFRVVKKATNMQLFFVAPTNVNFIDATATEASPADWAQPSSWSGGVVPGTESRISIGNTSSNSVPQRIEVKSLDLSTGQPVATADQLTVADQFNSITVGVKSGYTLLAATGSVTISKNGTVDLTDGGTVATPHTFELINGGVLRGTGTVKADDLIVTNGTVNPGATVGHLNVAGNYRLGANSKTVIDLQSDLNAQHDTIDVAGELELGGTLSFQFAPTSTLVAGDTFKVISSETIVANKTFRRVDSTGSEDLFVALDYPHVGQGAGSVLPTEVVIEGHVYQRGDMNHDGAVNGADIAYFALALSDSDQYFNKTLPNGACICDYGQAAGDLGRPAGYEGLGQFVPDGKLTFDDITAFAHRLDIPVGRMLAAMQVPEPSMASAAFFTLMASFGVRRRSNNGIDLRMRES